MNDKVQSLANDIYRDLIAKAGELSLQKESIDEQLKAIKAQLALLNSLVPELKKLVE